VRNDPSDEAPVVVQQLRALGLDVVMLSGDHHATATASADR